MVPHLKKSFGEIDFIQNIFFRVLNVNWNNTISIGICYKLLRISYFTLFWGGGWGGAVVTSPFFPSSYAPAHKAGNNETESLSKQVKKKRIK